MANGKWQIPADMMVVVFAACGCLLAVGRACVQWTAYGYGQSQSQSHAIGKQAIRNPRSSLTNTNTAAAYPRYANRQHGQVG